MSTTENQEKTKPSEGRRSERFPDDRLRASFVKIYHDLWQKVNTTYFRISSRTGQAGFSEYRDIGKVLEHSLQRSAHSLCLCHPDMPGGEGSPAVEIAVRLGNTLVHGERNPEAFREELANLRDDDDLAELTGEFMAHLGFNILLYCSHLAHVRDEVAPSAQSAIDCILKDASFSAVTGDAEAGKSRPYWLERTLYGITYAITAVLPTDLIRRVILRKRMKTFDPFQVDGIWLRRVYMPFFLDVSRDLDRMLIEEEEEKRRKMEKES